MDGVLRDGHRRLIHYITVSIPVSRMGITASLPVVVENMTTTDARTINMLQLFDFCCFGAFNVWHLVFNVNDHVLS